MTWEDAIESYKTYLILEKSLSSNSVEAYLNDIKKLAKYCADKIKEVIHKCAFIGIKLFVYI